MLNEEGHSSAGGSAKPETPAVAVCLPFWSCDGGLPLAGTKEDDGARSMRLAPATVGGAHVMCETHHVGSKVRERVTGQGLEDRQLQP